MESIILKLLENTSIFEVILIVVLGLIFYFRLKNNTDNKFEKLEYELKETNKTLSARIDKINSELSLRIDQVNSRLDNLYHELFRKAA